MQYAAESVAVSAGRPRNRRLVKYVHFALTDAQEPLHIRLQLPVNFGVEFIVVVAIQWKSYVVIGPAADGHSSIRQRQIV